MNHYDIHIAAVRQLAHISLECLYQSIHEHPEHIFPIGAHFRLTRFGGGLSVIVSISSPAMEIGLSHTPKTTLASDIEKRLSEASDLPLSQIDLARLNTAGTIAHYNITAQPSSHDLMDILGQSRMEKK